MACFINGLSEFDESHLEQRSVIVNAAFQVVGITLRSPFHYMQVLVLFIIDQVMKSTVIRA